MTPRVLHDDTAETERPLLSNSTTGRVTCHRPAKNVSRQLVKRQAEASQHGPPFKRPIDTLGIW